MFKCQGMKNLIKCLDNIRTLNWHTSNLFQLLSHNWNSQKLATSVVNFPISIPSFMISAKVALRNSPGRYKNGVMNPMLNVIIDRPSGRTSHPRPSNIPWGLIIKLNLMSLNPALMSFTWWRVTRSVHSIYEEIYRIYFLIFQIDLTRLSHSKVPWTLNELIIGTGSVNLSIASGSIGSTAPHCFRLMMGSTWTGKNIMKTILKK